MQGRVVTGNGICSDSEGMGDGCKSDEHGRKLRDDFTSQKAPCQLACQHSSYIWEGCLHLSCLEKLTPQVDVTWHCHSSFPPLLVSLPPS